MTRRVCLLVRLFVNARCDFSKTTSSIDCHEIWHKYSAAEPNFTNNF